VRGAVRAMTTLNKAATDVVTSGGFAVHAMTDVTGFGLIGHAREMAKGSGVSLRLFASKVPLLEGALEGVRHGCVPGGLKSNRGFAEGCVEYADEVAEEVRTLLYDPQTAGGLLISVAESDSERLIAKLGEAGVNAAKIGEVVEKEKPLIAVLA
jgi:selenide, water dikinase